MSDFSIAQSAIGLPSAGLGNASSETQFTTAQAQPGLAAGSLLMCRIPASNILKFRPFVLRIAGRITTGTTATFAPKLYFGGSTTIGSNTAVDAPGAGQSLATAKSNFYVEWQFYWDSTSSVLNGLRWGGFCGTTAYAQAATTQVTSFDISGTEVNLASTTGTSLVFNITGLFSSSNANNTAFLDEFDISAY